MKRIYILLIATLLLTVFAPAHAQLSSTITTRLHDPSFSVGRDFWLAIPSNEWGIDTNTSINDGPYIRIYITSASNTIAHIEYGEVRDSVPVTAYEISAFNVPEAWEMESSGIVENKGIHVFDTAAPITVYFISHQQYSSDGSYIIPTIGWGTDYVVAAYGAFFDAAQGSFDLPSECTIFADEDSTVVNITPSCDCRKCTSGSINGNPDDSVVAFRAGQTLSVMLNRGQSVQLMSVLATDPDNFDMTGTVIHASHPIGMIGASMQPNIPADFPYGDFVCEMIPPVRTWGETYYATNYEQAPGQTDKDKAQYLFISSQPGQEIDRYGFTDGFLQECIINNQFGIYWDELELGERFTSNAPFLVVSYVNSAEYPDNVNGLGDPAEVVIPCREHYTNTVLSSAPLSVGNIVPYDDYVEIICNVKDANRVLFDHKNINGYGAQPIDGQWEVINIPHVAPSVHEVTNSDSGIGVYCYGLGYDETYVWSSPEGVGTFHSPDSIAPRVDTMTDCYQTYIHVSDSGIIPNNVDTQTGLAAIWPDSSYNLIFHHDSDWIEGSGVDTSGYTVTVIDPTKPGILTVEVYDLAGNLTTITTTFKPDFLELKPPARNLGTWLTGNPPDTAYDTIYNVGPNTMPIDELELKYGNEGFTIFDSIGGPVDTLPLLAGHRRLIQILFEAIKPAQAVDSIIIGNSCFRQSVALVGGLADDFAVSDQTWPNEPLPAPDTGYPKPVTLTNLSNTGITIDSAWWADTVHFKAVSSFPLVLMRTAEFTIAYFPDSNSVTTYNRTEGRWFSPMVTESGVELAQNDSLIGWAIPAPPSGVGKSNNFTLQATILSTNDGLSLEIILPAAMTGPVNFSLVNVLGESVLHETFESGTQNIDVSTLPRGVYFYRLTSGQMSQSGKVILGE